MNEIKTEIKKDLKEFVLTTVKAFASIIPVTIYFYALIFAMPQIFVVSYNKFLELGMTDLHATNVATIFTAFASVVGLIVMYKIDKVLKQSHFDKTRIERMERMDAELKARNKEKQKERATV